MNRSTVTLSGAIILMLSVFLSLGVVAQPGGGMGGGAPDLSEAAETLGVSEEQLLEALGGPPPNFEAAAETLGISEEDLMKALPAPPEGGGRPQ